MNTFHLKTPLYLCPPICKSCGKQISKLKREYDAQIKKISSGSITDIPLRTIDEEFLLKNSKKNSKTPEGKILDDLCIYRYCCRSTIMTQPKVRVPIKS